MFYGGLLSDFWEILGLGLYRALCSGNRLNIFGPLSQILKVISAQFATFSCGVFGGRNQSPTANFQTMDQHFLAQE